MSCITTVNGGESDVVAEYGRCCPKVQAIDRSITDVFPKLKLSLHYLRDASKLYFEEHASPIWFTPPLLAPFSSFFIFHGRIWSLSWKLIGRRICPWLSQRHRIWVLFLECSPCSAGKHGLGMPARLSLFLWELTRHLDLSCVQWKRLPSF